MIHIRIKLILTNDRENFYKISHLNKNKLCSKNILKDQYLCY